MSVRRLIAGLFGGSVEQVEMASHLAVAHNNSPFLTVYKRNGDTFDKLPNPSALPASNSFGVAFSPDGNHLAVAHGNSPYLTVYKRNGDTFDKLPDPSALPASTGYGVAFSPDGNHLAVAHGNSPYLTVYKRNGDTFDKLPDPSALPASTGNGVAFSPDSNYLAMVHSSSPYLTVYKRNGDTFDKLPNPSALPASVGRGVAFSPDGNHLAVAHSYSPNLTVYKRNGDTFDKLPNPSALPASTGYGVAFSPDGNHLAVAHGNSPYLTVYKRNGDTFDKLPNPSALPASIGRGVAFSPDGNHLAVAHNNSPFLTVYKRNGDTFDKLPNPSALPADIGRGIAFSPLIGPPPPGPLPGTIGTAGEQGFGVGVCPDEHWLTELNLSEMDGTRDPSSPNYGNYQHENGGIAVFIPKFFYRIGSEESPHYAKYGLNCIDIVGIETFGSEAEANAAGYALHRAFIDDGKEKSGFFYDKYLASKDGTTSCKSVKMGQPISFTTDTGYVRSSDMVGCTGIAADAVVLSRARGEGWNAVSLFMADAIAKIALAHGMAATSDEFCAWYDPAGETNFPKGCNNDALGDVDDPTLTFESSGEADPNKPLTGSASNLAKTTHNGQESGITDVNGPMYQMTIGVTQDGPNATSTNGHLARRTFVMKRSTRHATLTGGWGGPTDAWGNTSSLPSLFDQISNFYPWGDDMEWGQFGSGGAQVFSGAIEGIEYLKSCCGVPRSSSAWSSSGTPLFGNDGCFRRSRHNASVLIGGGWDLVTRTGVFYRSFSGTNRTSNQYNGFRAAAYGS